MREHLPAPGSPGLSTGPSRSLAERPSHWLGDAETTLYASEDLTWRRYWRAIVRAKWWILLCTVLGGLGGAGLTQVLPPKYVAQATIWVEVEDARGPRIAPIQSDQLLESSGWVDLLKSYVVLDHVVRERRLYVRPESPADTTVLALLHVADSFLPGRYRLKVDNSGRTFTLLGQDGRVLQGGAAGDSVGWHVGLRWRPEPALLRPGGTVAFELATLRDAAQRLSEELQVRIDPNGNFLRLELRGSDPHAITATVNAVAERFVEMASELKLARVRELTTILDEQLRSTEEQMRKAQAQWQAFRARTITEPSEPLTAGDARLAPSHEAYFQMKMELEQIKRDRATIRSALSQPSDNGLSVIELEAIPSVQRSSELLQALDTLASQHAEYRALRHRYTEIHPRVHRLQREIEELERLGIPPLAAALQAQLNRRQTELEARLGEQSQELRSIPARTIEEAQLRQQATLAETLYSSLRQRYEEARLAAASVIPDARILDHAITPRWPINGEMAPRIIALAFLGSLGLSVFGVLVLDRFDPRLRYPEHVEEQLGLPVLGVVPRIQKENGNLTLDSRLRMIEAFRGIRYHLLTMHGSSEPLVLTISSPAMGEGKSMTSAALALAFADLGYPTVLIDGDVRRGRLHRLLGLSAAPGLTEFLGGRASRDQVVQETPYPLVDLIAMGSGRSDAPELLSSGAMSELLRDLTARYRVILVDSPPLSAAADSHVLGTLTGRLLLVLRIGRTDRDLARVRLQTLRDLPIEVLGVVLNDAPAERAYQYYGYVGQNGSAEGDPARSAKRWLVHV